MTSNDLERLIEELRIAGTDSSTVEVKAAATQVPTSLRETISAFANGDGGTIILGLSEVDNFAPVAGFKASAIRDGLAQMCSDDFTPPVRADIDIIPFQDAVVVLARVPGLLPKDKPCYISERGQYKGSFIRAGDGDRKLSYYEIDRLLENRTQPEWDKQIVEEATLEDLDERLVAGLLKKERTQSPRIFGQKSDTDALIALQVLGEGEDGHLHPRLGGLLALGFHPQKFFPRLYVSFAVYPGSDKTSSPSGIRFLDSKTFLGSIPYMVNDVVEHVVANMRTGGLIQGSFRRDLPDYPPVAVREAVTNALMHRDYSPESRGAQVQVNMFVDRLEVINPGGLFGAVTVETLVSGTAIPGSRNAVLSRLLESAPYPDGGFVAENRGSGYQEIERQLSHNLLPPPVPQDRLTQFSLHFPRRAMRTAERGAAAGSSSSERILDYLRKHRTATSRELSAAAGIGLGGTRKVLNGLIEQGLVERTEPARSPKQRYRLIMDEANPNNE